jgi:hypothetical protein
MLLSKSPLVVQSHFVTIEINCYQINFAQPLSINSI